MTVTFGATNAAVSAKASDLIESALLELGVVGPGETMQPEDAQWGLQKLQRLIDQWNASRDLIFSISFSVFTLLANHAPHTIGPGGDFNTPIRPVDVRSASFILNSGGSSAVDMPIQVKDKDWWAVNPVKSLQSSIVTHLYYDPANPLGNLNFWPICTIGNPVRLEIWNSLQQAISLNSVLGFPQGYWEAVVMELAIKLLPSYPAAETMAQLLRENWNQAMRVIEANNYAPPKIDTDSGGLPNSRRGGRPDFNFLTGLRE